MAAMTRQDRACSIALEHIRWAQENGQSPRSIIKALGERCSVHATWDDAFAAVVIAWTNLDLGSAESVRKAA
jgi:hypothetical protein